MFSGRFLHNEILLHLFSFAFLYSHPIGCIQATLFSLPADRSCHAPVKDVPGSDKACPRLKITPTLGIYGKNLSPASSLPGDLVMDESSSEDMV